MQRCQVFCLLALAWPASAAAAEPDAGAPRPAVEAPARALPAPPTADEIKRVLEYQEHGRDRGPVLLDLVPCLTVDTTRGSPTYFTCLEPVSGPVKRGTTVNAWTAWLCPKGGVYDDLAIQFVHEGQVRLTVDVKVESLARYRTYRPLVLGRPGRWVLKVLRANRELASAEVEVVE